MSCIIICIIIVVHSCAIGICLADGKKNEEKWCLNFDESPPKRQIYDGRMFDCKGGKLVKKGPPPILTTPTPTPTERPEPEKRLEPEPEEAPFELQLQSVVGNYTGPCDSQEDELLCHGTRYCGKTSGYACCGYGKVHPPTQTCCMQMPYRFRVHEHMPDRKHICCGLDAVRRSPDVPCHHAAKNDGLWRKAKSAKKLLKTIKHCMEHDHVVLIKMGDTRSELGRMFYSSKIRIIENGRPSKSTGILQKKVPIDRYSPTRSLKNKWLLVYSRFDPLGSTIDFYLRPDDLVFKGKNVKALKRKAKAAHKICRVIRKANRKVNSQKGHRRRKNSKKNSRVRHL